MNVNVGNTRDCIEESGGGGEGGVNGFNVYIIFGLEDVESTSGRVEGASMRVSFGSFLGTSIVCDNKVHLTCYLYSLQP